MSRAVGFARFGGPEVLEPHDMPTAQPATDEVVVEVHAAGVNFADVAQRRNAYLWEPPLPFVPGYEAAGEIVAVGDAVDDRQVGQRVLAILPNGGYATHVRVSARATVPLPAGVDPAAATALLVQGLTAYHVLTTRARLQPGERVVVHAAAGGVGTPAVQIAKLLGAGPVIATAGSPAKLDLARSLGADVGIDYRADRDWPDRVREATTGAGADVILEMRGDDGLERDLSCLAPFGRVVVFGAAGGPFTSLPPTSLMPANQTVYGFYLARRQLDGLRVVLPHELGQLNLALVPVRDSQGLRLPQNPPLLAAQPNAIRTPVNMQVQPRQRSSSL